MRLCKYLAHCGVASRRASDALVFGGRVTIGGETVLEPGRDVRDGDDVRVDGKPVLPEAEKVVYAFNKPSGVICTSSDPEGRKKVSDYFSDLPYRLYTVGRLDFDSEGLVLVTNDGDLANLLTHPRHGAQKQYYVVCGGHVSEAGRRRLENGVELEDGLTAPAAVRILNTHKDSTELVILLREGRNRQVRRMLDVIGHPVKKLRRESIGPVSLSSLPRGERRRLDQTEIDSLRLI